MSFSFSQPHMASPSANQRPTAARQTSYSHQTPRDENQNPKLPARAQTFQNGASLPAKGDAFDTAENPDDDNENIEITRASIDLSDLPIELVTFTDSFIESLNAKVNPAPPTIEKLAARFQDFYAQASSHINTHISALATRNSRDASPSAASTISLAANRIRSKASSLGAGRDKNREKEAAEQQMITTEELAGRKQMRKTLEAKRSLLEEAVERSLCEGMYDRIYRHKSTQDEAMDDKLRSKTAALDLVGIGPADLGVDLGEGPEPTAEAIANKTSELAQMLEGARKDVVHMHESKYPLGKLNRLKAAHRSIVDALAHFHPSASADEIMPMLIFTLITLPPENLNVISDINFIQSFRWEPKLTGEAAYCLTNLEAAISFLQTVDLATLRSDELPSGPPKSTSPKTETFPPAYASASGSGAETAKDTVSGSKPAASTNQQKTPTPLRHRRLSDLVNTPAQAFGAASDAVFTTADQSLKNISNSLGDSYKFLLGKLRERQDSPRESIDVPRTLADARKLVGTPPPEEEGNASGTSSLFGGDEDGKRLSVREDRMLNLIGGRRDRSADSAVSGRSAGSSKPGPAAAGSGQSNPPVLDQMRNLGNSFNPMARLQSMSVMRGFTRNVSQPTPPPATETKAPADGGDLASAFPDIAAALPPKPKIAPPSKRFMELQNPGDLKINEVLELLRDYRRLAGALKDMDAFTK